ncbi:hypothetical protein GCM10010156_40800 [Planobispora rosea]|uniref:Phage late control D family protein n=1 Tax=Planobispora rosea TaxID=35762 RepID=A0A8J3WF55_PLARO|nr:contractile injection system protein, VgrG/Pvc8 family [Planobispora rosea]GGS77843.1 hypothetical protein GCM10010156_40800 [Planobispora rosea]GIH85606.1 hypothetical protein Pro02_40140 [Planobispora rosea]
MGTPYLDITWQGNRKLSASALEVRVEDHDRLIDQATLTLSDPAGTGAATVQPGQRLTIDLGWDGEHAVIFEGLVAETRAQAPQGGPQVVTVVARDLSQLMQRERRPHEDYHGTLGSVVRAVAARHPEIPIGQVACDPDPSFPEDRPVRQHDQTDYEFLLTLAQRYGARFFVEYNEGASKLYFVSDKKIAAAEPLGVLPYCRGRGKLIAFTYENVAARAARRTSVSVHDPMTGEVRKAEGTAPPRPPALAVDSGRAAEIGRADPAARAVYESAVAAGTVTPPPAVTDTAVAVASDPAAAEQATVPDPTRLLGLRGTGRAVGTVMLRAKGKVTIHGIAPWAEGDWYVSRATHIWRDTSAGGRPGASYEVEFTATR